MSDEIEEMLSQDSAQESVSEQPEAETPPEPEVEAAPEVEEAPETPPEEPEKAEPVVPLSAFTAMRDDFRAKFDELRQQVGGQQEQNREPPKAPDMFAEPEKYTQFINGQVQQSIVAAKLEMSRFQAEREFGKDAVAEVIQYFDQNPQQSQQFLNAPSPFHAAKEFYDAQRAAQEIGNDPAAYKSKLEAEIRQKIEAEMAAKQASGMARKPAPTLAGVNGTGGTSDPGWQGPTDLSSIIGD